MTKLSEFAAGAPTKKHKWVGESVPRKEDSRLLSGSGNFVDDMKLPNMHHVAILRSPYAHARINGIDMSKALELPGVVCGLTGGEVGQLTKPFSVVATSPLEYYCMAVDRARFVGEAVAAVVARDRYIAEDALDLIEVDYDVLPAVVDPEKALEPGASVLHDKVGSNLVAHRVLNYGDVETAFKDADLVVKDRFVFPRYTSMPLETFAVIGKYDQFEDTMTLWSNFMGPFIMHPITARALNIPENQLRFIIPADIGGSFGIKSSIYPYLVMMGLLAKKANVPVKWLEDRREHLLAASSQTDRIGYREAAFKKDGTLLGIRSNLYDNVGGYLRTPEPATTFRPIGNVVGPYNVKNIKIDAHIVTTNKCPTGPNRGYGCQHIYFEQELLMDQAAEKLGLDPADIRFKNLVQANEFPYTTPSGGIYDSGDYPKALQLALDMADYKGLRETQKKARAEGRLYGIGFGIGVDPSVSNMGYLTVALDPEVRGRPDYLPKSGAAQSVTMKMDPLGKVTVFLTTTPQGQGHETTIAQIVADELGIAPDDVMVVDECDTAKNVWSISSGTYASRFSSVATSAVAEAARLLNGKIRRIAAMLLKTSEEQLQYVDGKYSVQGAPQKSIRLSHVAGTAHWNPDGLPTGMEVGLQVMHTFSFGVAKPPDAKDRVNSSNTYGFMADIIVVEVNRQTGDVKILKYVSVHDAGTIINPKIMEGQIYGGALHGIAGALYEELSYDDDGQMLAATLVDYEVPFANEAPKLDIGHICSPSPITPLGSKGAGESSTETAPAAIGNAVADALRPLGVHINELPLTPTKVWALMQAAAGKGKAK